MDTLQRLFNRLVGIAPPPARSFPDDARQLPRTLERPACWRRAAKVRITNVRRER